MRTALTIVSFLILGMFGFESFLLYGAIKSGCTDFVTYLDIVADMFLASALYYSYRTMLKHYDRDLNLIKYEKELIEWLSSKRKK